MKKEIAPSGPNQFEAACPRHREFNNVWEEQRPPRPVADHFKLARKARKFAQVDASPQHPGDESRDTYAENLCDRVAIAQRSEHAEHLERERFGRLAFERAHQIRGKLFGLPHRELCRWRTGFFIVCVRNNRAVADCPYVVRTLTP